MIFQVAMDEVCVFHWDSRVPLGTLPSHCVIDVGDGKDAGLAGQLSSDALAAVLSFLAPVDLAATAGVSRAWRAVTAQDRVWAPMLVRLTRLPAPAHCGRDGSRVRRLVQDTVHLLVTVAHTNQVSMSIKN